MSKLAWAPLTEGSGTIVGPDGQALAHYDWRRANHPYFDQVRALTHAGVLTNHAPHDHRWHHGLWWSWKFVNDVLFWEDHPEYGGNRIGLGRSTVTDHAVREINGTVVIHEQLAWQAVSTGEKLLHEERHIVAAMDQTKPDRWLLDWDQTWTAEVPVLFESTPWPATSWGGYGGLNYRPARSMAAGETILGAGLDGASALHGARSPWASYTGLVDGAETDEPRLPARGGVALLQHPGNPRYPDPVYSFSADDGFGFLSTAPLMHEPLSLDVSEAMRIRTRVVVLGEPTDENALAAAHHSFVEDQQTQPSPL